MAHKVPERAPRIGEQGGVSTWPASGPRAPQRYRRAGPTNTYLVGREALGARLVVPRDPAAAAEALAELHGGRARAAAWLRDVLDAIAAEVPT